MLYDKTSMFYTVSSEYSILDNGTIRKLYSSLDLRCIVLSQCGTEKAKTIPIIRISSK